VRTPPPRAHTCTMMGPGGPQVHVINTNTKRETGRKAQLGNIAAAKASPRHRRGSVSE